MTDDPTPPPPDPAIPPDADWLAREELAIRRKELEVRELEARKALAGDGKAWWQRAEPMTLAVLGAILTIVGNIVVGYFNNRATIEQEEHKAANDLALETKKAQYSLILQAMATTDRKSAGENINFFVESGLLDDANHRIRNAAAKFQPVLPSPSGASAPPLKPVEATDVAKLYNFPASLDGAGQVVGILEFGGGYDPKEIAKHFATRHRSPPSITDVAIAGGRNHSQSGADGEVALNIEAVGAIAPAAAQRLYFASFSVQGWTEALHRAVADHVSVLLICWGKTESQWDRAELLKVDEALEAAARSGITIVVAGGDQLADDGVGDGRRHVNFPASSRWVLSVGGTSIRSESGAISAESVWKDDGIPGFGSGGGVSEVFDRPAWQAGVAGPARADGAAGRAIPDVAATATSSLIVTTSGASNLVGGTSVSASVWAALIALTNQGLGYNVGYVTPRLYGDIGPAGVLRGVTEGDNDAPKVRGFKAGPGWNPVAGWGTPDGEKLLAWLQEHRQPQ
jgi:kumamolisin